MGGISIYLAVGGLAVLAGMLVVVLIARIMDRAAPAKTAHRVTGTDDDPAESGADKKTNKTVGAIFAAIAIVGGLIAAFSDEDDDGEEDVLDLTRVEISETAR